MKVLFVAARMPEENDPGTMIPAKRQMDSIIPNLEKADLVEIKGLPFLKYVSAAIRIRSISKHFDLIHAHYGISGFISTLVTSKPVVMSVMGSDILASPSVRSITGKLRMELEHAVTRAAYRKSARSIAKSEEIAEALGSGRVEIVPNGVNMTLFQERSQSLSREKCGITLQGPSVLFGGNPGDPRKNFKLAEEAVAEAERLTGATINMITLSNVSPDTVPDLMNSCDAMLFTSLTEGSPNVVKEALACNTPVVSVRVGDTDFLLGDVEGCALCGYDAGELGKALSETLLRRGRIDGRQSLMEKGLDMNSVAERIIELYESVLVGIRAESPER